MIRFAALTVLAAVARCGPAPDGYVHGGATTGYSQDYYDRPYWGPSYYPAPAYRGHPHGGYGYRGGPPGGSPHSRQFWGTERAERPGNARRDQDGFWGGGQRAAPSGPSGRGGPPIFGSGRREGPRGQQGED